MKIAIATSCTNRKRFHAIRALQGKHLPRRSSTEIAEEWVRRIRNARPVSLAHELYQGRAFKEARDAAEELRADFYIVSAGLGLIPGGRGVPSYSLTVTERSTDNVLRRCTDESVSPEKWWKVINKEFNAKSLAPRVARSEHDYWLIALPTTYYRMVRDDLSRLSDEDLARVRLFGPRPAMTADDVVLQKTLISVDERLDGPDSCIRGTRSDFAQRAMAFFVHNVLVQAPTADVVSHRKATSQLLRRMRWPGVMPQRTTASDEEICKKLDQFWKKANGKSTKLLRILRDDLLIACEENRFRRLYHSLAMRRST